MKMTLWCGHPLNGGQEVPGKWVGTLDGLQVFQPSSAEFIGLPGLYVMREDDTGNVEITPS